MKTDVLLVAVRSVVALSPWLGRVTRLPVPTVQFVCGCLLAIVPAAIFVAVLTVRLAWILVWTVLLRTFDRGPQQREIRVPSRARLVTVWGGLRGGISLAAALTIPSESRG